MSKKNSSKLLNTWHNISGTMVLNSIECGKGKNKFNKWCTRLYKADENGNYDTLFIDVSIKDFDAEDYSKAIIDVEKAFITLRKYTNKEDKTVVVPVIVVQEFKEIETED